MNERLRDMTPKLLKDDGQPFHKYQNKQSPLIFFNNFTNVSKTNNYLSPQIIEHKKKYMTFANGNLDPGLGQAQKCGGVKLHATIPLQLKEKLHFYARFSFYCGPLRANCIVYIFLLSKHAHIHDRPKWHIFVALSKCDPSHNKWYKHVIYRNKY